MEYPVRVCLIFFILLCFWFSLWIFIFLVIFFLDLFFRDFFKYPSGRLSDSLPWMPDHSFTIHTEKLKLKTNFLISFFLLHLTTFSKQGYLRVLIAWTDLLHFRQFPFFNKICMFLHIHIQYYEFVPVLDYLNHLWTKPIRSCIGMKT